MSVMKVAGLIAHIGVAIMLAIHVAALVAVGIGTYLLGWKELVLTVFGGL